MFLWLFDLCLDLVAYHEFDLIQKYNLYLTKFSAAKPVL